MTLPELLTCLESKTGLKPRRSGEGYVCRCPAHEDGSPSLTVAEGQGGRLLVNCKAGCSFRAVVTTLGLKESDLFPDKPGRNGGGKPPGRSGPTGRAGGLATSAAPATSARPSVPPAVPATGAPARQARRLVAAYDYRDESGKLLFQVCRFEPKDFRQRRPDPDTKDGWTWRTTGLRRVLYRLPELHAGVKAGRTVFIAEGEKDCDTLAKAGFVATCNPGGAGKWLDEFTDAFRGAVAAIIADKDVPGRTHAAAVAAKLKPVARSVKVLELPDVSGRPVKDAADFLAAGGTADLLRQLITQAPEWGADARAGEVAAPPFYYHKEKQEYWRQTPGGEFVKASESDIRRHLKFGGFRVGEFEGPFGVTKFDSAIVKVQNESAVDHVLCLAGHRPGIFRTEDGRGILVPRTPAVIRPAAGGVANWDRLIGELFGPEQTPYFLAWLKLALQDRQKLDPEDWRHHQLLALVGKPDCGKSFLQGLITSLLGGREADPYLWMVGKTDFNEDLAEAEHWKMEDKNAHRDAKSRSAFGGAIKQACVNHNLAVHGKGKKQILLPCFHVLTISINDDPEYITVLPMLDSSVADKITILKCGRATMLPEWKANRARFMAEVPALADFLLNVFPIPPELQHGRYGVKHYHAPDVVELLQQFEPHLKLLEVVDAAIFNVEGIPTDWTGSSAELQSRLCEGAFGAQARQLLSYSTACGVYLSKLAEARPDRVEKKRVKGVHKWTISPPR